MILYVICSVDQKWRLVLIFCEKLLVFGRWSNFIEDKTTELSYLGRVLYPHIPYKSLPKFDFESLEIYRSKIVYLNCREAETSVGLYRQIQDKIPN